MRHNGLRQRLLISYLVVGLLNLIVISFFIYSLYNNRRSIIINRTMAHMTSVRSLNATKLKLSLDKYKLNADINSELLSIGKEVSFTDPAIESVWVKKGPNLISIYGQTKVGFTDLDSLPKNHFIEHSKDIYALKIVRNNATYIWVYNYKLLDDIFQARNGMGETGEVYLVGKDHKIRTASRHVRDWKDLSVNNDVVLNALENTDGTSVTKDYRNVEVVSAYALFQYDSLEFVLLAEIDTQEITAQLSRLLEDLLIICGSLIAINFFFSVFFTRSMSSKVNKLSQEIFQLNLQKERQVNESAIQVIKVQEEEREKISFTLHDSVGQYLTVLRWGLTELKTKCPQEKEHIANLTKTCDDIIHEIRSISHDLMPTLIKDFGCCLAIKDYFEKQKQIVPLEMSFHYTAELEGAHFRREFDVNLYRMVQEFFQNTLKHSGATTLNMELLIKNDKMELIYSDNGKGMDPKSPLPTSLSYRAKLFGGEMIRVNYDNGLGFKVTFNLKDIGYEATN